MKKYFSILKYILQLVNLRDILNFIRAQMSAGDFVIILFWKRVDVTLLVIYFFSIATYF